MEGWKTDKFKNQIQYKSGYTWSKEQELKAQEPNSVRVLTVTNIQKDLDLSEELYLKGVNEKDKKEKAVSKDWCIAVSSNGNRKRIGNAVFIKDNTDYLFASFLTAFKPKDNSEILPDFFFRWLSSHNVQERITSVSEGTTGLGNLDIRYLRNMDIHFPDKSEQTAIVTILSKVDEAIASVQASISAAERLKKSLMQNLLTGRMKPDGTLRTEEEFYVDEKFGKVPKGWKIEKFGKRVVLLYGKSQKEVVSEAGTIPVYGTGGIIEYATKALCNHKSILVGRKGTIDKPYFIDEPFWAVDTTYYVDTFINGNMKYLYYILLRMNLGSLNEATGVPSVTRRTINRQKVVIPPLDEQNSIVNVIEKIEKQIDNKQSKIATLEQLKKSLMQNLLTGRLRVKCTMNNEQLK